MSHGNGAADVSVAGLFVYPLKSACGIPLQEGEVVDRGFLYDRHWTLVDGQGVAVTQRTAPRMALIQVALTSKELVVDAPGMKSIALPLKSVQGRRRTVKVWNDVCDSMSLGDVPGRWFSDFLQLDCELVSLPDDANRPVDPRYSNGMDKVGYADAFPFLLLSSASLVDLNRRLDAPLGFDRFRPNIVVKGCDPFAEDSWGRFDIGPVSFRVAKPCGRCSVPLVDQSTGHVGREPLRTLATYRTVEGKVLFGQNLVHRGRGVIRIGDGVVPH